MSTTHTLESFVHALPKCELHVHLEGCLTPDLAKSLATRNNVPLSPSIASASNTSGYPFHDLTSLLAIYYPILSVLRTRRDFHDVAWEYLVRAAAQNVRRAELFFDPQAHTSRGVGFDVVLDGYWDAAERAGRDLGVSVGLIMCIMRDRSVESAVETVDAGLKPGNRERILGLGLDGDSGGNPPQKFAEVFERARRESRGEWKLTMHCDVDQPDTLEHIRQALVEVQVDRVDHGTNVVGDRRLVDVLKQKGIGLTCCPISNSVVTTDFKGKEILGLLREGVKVTVNSDDPAYFRAYVGENLIMFGKGTDASWREIVRFQKNAFEIAWVSEKEREGWLKALDEFEQSVLGD